MIINTILHIKYITPCALEQLQYFKAINTLMFMKRHMTSVWL